MKDARSDEHHGSPGADAYADHVSFELADLLRLLLVVYDSPDERRLVGKRGVLADRFPSR